MKRKIRSALRQGVIFALVTVTVPVVLIGLSLIFSIEYLLIDEWEI